MTTGGGRRGRETKARGGRGEPLLPVRDEQERRDSGQKGGEKGEKERGEADEDSDVVYISQGVNWGYALVEARRKQGLQN